MKNKFCECAHSLDKVIGKLDYDKFCEKELCLKDSEKTEIEEKYFSNLARPTEKMIKILGGGKIRKNFIPGGVEFIFIVKKTRYKMSVGFTTPGDYLPGEKGTLSITSSKNSYFNEKIYKLPNWRQGLGSIFSLPEQNPI